MSVKNKKILVLLLLTACLFSGYSLWLSLLQVEVVAVHDNDNHSYVLVRSFPFTNKGKIDWWQKNKDRLKEKYNIPKPDKEGYFTIIFWLFGKGYQETDGYDRLCFEDIQPPLNCIDKDAVFSVSNSSNLGTTFTTYNGKYQLQKNGEVVKLIDKFEYK